MKRTQLWLQIQNLHFIVTNSKALIGLLANKILDHKTGCSFISFIWKEISNGHYYQWEIIKTFLLSSGYP